MNESPAFDESDAAALDELVFRYLEELESSDSDPDRLLDELCASDPSSESQLRAAVERLRAAGLLPVDSETFPERIGDFRLLRRLGAGGMGVVYLAEQISLGRRVALKLVRPEQLYFKRTRERFRREVESAARLGHPGIAHVHTVGEENGIPFFAQEYVPGASLDVVLRAIPAKTAEGLSGRDLARALADRADETPQNTAFFDGSWESVCVRIARSVAEALQHAHERGVLHRDVKPSNLILTPDGRVVLVDFGLADLADANALTRTGAQLGSLPYMSPEQVDGRAADIGPRSDVYALGVTLYELLTLRAPFGGDSSERLRRQILDARPLSPRAHNPALSVDVETVCLCAMDADAPRRYADAAAFAEDLDNILARKPPHARPVSHARRVLRWAQRRPAEAAAIALGVVLLVGGPLAWGAVQASHAADMENAAQRESRASARAQSHFLTVLDTLDSMIRRFGEAELEELPGMTALRLAQIERVLVTYRELELERPGDPLLCERHAWAHRFRGNALHQMGRFTDAISAFGDGLRVLEPSLGVLDERHGDRIWEQGALHALRARSHAQNLDIPASISDGARGVECMGRSLSHGPEHRKRRGDLVTAIVNLASAHRRAGDRERCVELLEDARVNAEEWLGDEALSVRQRLGYLNLLIAEARLAGFDGELDAELELRLEVVERLDIELLDPLGWTEWAATLVPALSELAALYARRGERDEQARILDRAVRESRKLIEAFPYRSIHRLEFLHALSDRADLARHQGRFEVARAGMLDVAREHSNRLALDPSNESMRLGAAAAWVNSANVVLMSTDLGAERYEQALGQLARAVELLDEAAGDMLVRRATVRRNVAYNRVVCFSNLGRIDEARASLAVLEEQRHTGAGELRFLADAWNEWFLGVERRGAAGDDERAMEGRTRAMTLLEQSVAAGYADVRELRSTPALDALRTEPRFVALLERLVGDD